MYGGRTSSSSSKSSPLKQSDGILGSGNTPLAAVHRPKGGTMFNRTASKDVQPVDDTMSIDWVSDTSVRDCVMCEKKFNTFKRRRHHCRQCGRVVCWSCSTKKLVLQAAHFQNTPQRVCDGCYFTLTEKKHAKVHATSLREKEEQLLHTSSYISDCLIRVFFLDGSFITVSYDDCSTAADVIERVCLNVRCALFEVNQDMRDRDQYALLLESDTIVDIIARWSLGTRSNAKLVLPLYEQNESQIGNSPQPANVQPWRVHGSLVGRSSVSSAFPPRDSEWHDVWEDDVSSVASAMEESGILHPNQVSNSYNSATGGKGTSPLVGSASKQSHLSGKRYDSQHSPLRDSDVGDDDFRQPMMQRSTSGSTGTAELAHTKEQLAALQKKYDLLKNIHSRQTLQRTSSSTGAGHQSQHTPSTATNKYRGESYDIFDEKTNMSGRTSPSQITRDAESISESSFFQNDSEDEESIVYSRDASIDRGNMSSKTPKDTKTRNTDVEQTAKRSFWRSTFSFRRSGSTSTSSMTPSKQQQASSTAITAHNMESKVMSSGHVVSPIKRPVSIATPSRDRTDSVASTSSMRAGPELILLSPKDVQSMVRDIDCTSADFQQLVRTFFYQTASVENFLLKFQCAIRTLMEMEQDTAGDRSTSGVKIDVGNVKRAFENAPSIVDDSLGLTHVFEMTWALEGLYAFVLGVAEEWSNEVRCWLLVMLKECLKPPLFRPNHLKQLVTCLKRMEMLHSPLAQSTIQACVDQLFSSEAVVIADRKKLPSLPLDGVGHDNSVLRAAASHSPGATALAAIRRTGSALSVLVEDLMPAFPNDVGLLNMYVERATRVIRFDIFDFFIANKTTLSGIDVLTVFSFAEYQRQTLVSLGADLPILQELEHESFAVYLQVIDTYVRHAMTRIHTADERAVAQEGHKQNGIPSGFMTTWPSELMTVYGEQLALVARHLQPKAREIVWGSILDTLPDFVSKQKTWVCKMTSTSSKNTCIDRLCAHINNHLYFADNLESKLDILSADLDDSAAERVTTHYHRITALFTAHADYALHLLMQQVILEVRNSLQSGLFRNGWDNSVQMFHTTKRLLQAFKGSLFSWLRDAPFASAVLAATAVSICDTYVETLLSAKPDITANTLDRLQEDYQLWDEVLHEYAIYLKNPSQLQVAQSSWKHILTALSIDTRNMQAFVRNEMYPAFGAATMKIWAIIMQMRDESKQVFDVFFEIIIMDWNPKPLTPYCNVDAFIAKLKNPKQKMVFPSNSIFRL